MVCATCTQLEYLHFDTVENADVNALKALANLQRLRKFSIYYYTMIDADGNGRICEQRELFHAYHTILNALKEGGAPIEVGLVILNIQQIYNVLKHLFFDENVGLEYSEFLVPADFAISYIIKPFPVGRWYILTMSPKTRRVYIYITFPGQILQIIRHFLYLRKIFPFLENYLKYYLKHIIHLNLFSKKGAKWKSTQTIHNPVETIFSKKKKIFIKLSVYLKLFKNVKFLNKYRCIINKTLNLFDSHFMPCTCQWIWRKPANYVHTQNLWPKIRGTMEQQQELNNKGGNGQFTWFSTILINHCLRNCHIRHLSSGIIDGGNCKFLICVIVPPTNKVHFYLFIYFLHTQSRSEEFHSYSGGIAGLEMKGTNQLYEWKFWWCIYLLLLLLCFIKRTVNNG